MNFFGEMFGGQPGVYGGIQRGQNPWLDANFLGNIEQAQREGAGYSGPALGGGLASPSGFAGPLSASKSTRQINGGPRDFAATQGPMGDRMALNLDPSLLGNPTVTPNGPGFLQRFGEQMKNNRSTLPQAPELPGAPMMGRNGRNMIAELLQSIGGGGNFLGRLGSL